MNIKRVITITMTTITGAMIAMSGVMKLMGGKEVTDKISQVGMANYLVPLAAMEFIFAVLFLFPKTMKIGFVLLTCYFSGAMATDLSHGMTMANAAFVLALVWITAFLRDRSIFLPVQKAQSLA